jgi:D-alanyl-D-alanine carboxypeptidase/D-alanyl-D-alanine-endopeptidase (penicillin-binding protein 4)
MARIAALCALLVALLAPGPARAADATRTASILSSSMAQAGGVSGALAVDLDTGEVLYQHRAGRRYIPASVNKLFTSATTLLQLGPAGTLTTPVLAEAPPDELGVLHGDLWLVGAGDPTFDGEDAAELAALLTASGVLEVRGRVVGDESAWDARRGPPSEGFVTSPWVGPLSALGFAHGVTGRRSPYWQSRPALFAARAFTRALRAAGVRVRRAAAEGIAPLDVVTVAEWTSPPAGTLIALANAPSDNYVAEMLIKALGAQFGTGGTTSEGAQVVRAVVARLGVRPQVVDGSGLSRANRTSPRQVVALLDAMTVEPAFEASLAVAGRTGTLVDRMRRGAARGRCRAKTGSLIGVSALAGYCTTRAGRRVAFAFLMNGISVTRARTLQDRMTSALARYG